MIRILKIPFLIMACMAINFAKAQEKKYVLVVHGGAGTIVKSSMTPAKEKAYIDALTMALQSGYKILQKGGSSLDAVEAAILVLEDNPLFNAGKGAVFTHTGRNELDASIMEGSTLRAGAVAGVTTIKNPISAARAVMEKSEHVLLTGKGAETFAKEVGITMVDPKYFWTKDRWDGLQEALKADSLKNISNKKSMHTDKYGTKNMDHKFGTVGCVALDKLGNLAAGTSTGGMTNKKYGRVGDSPIIGAGTYCDNSTAGISCTGWGEFFIRTVAAKTVSDLIAYKDYTIDQSAEIVLGKIKTLGGDGGLIALDKEGNMAMPFNTAGMYRGAITEDGKVEVFIYR
ncbi:MAG TPA: isoaspartyl peptidase/L-asparaginase [Niabella sp.]|nr:isoaspartyl peptidase/L-asparaginase [Niabella sp.]HOZ96574.1 isoaspartyl peptidase/L-asparaginase [Niabella sp.]HQW13245.1 isoaspartyl peptidase/L-asparaginase [Niabella sp.]HQX18715.1 isoaspartyl peptidase/L-asparaginase [Niabella sp.]HQX41855.1 isoaspartyl peptidase/L-asparaginase [Niabella sp.]